MKLTIPKRRLLSKTGEVDYYDWNYKFPIKYVQKYRFKRVISLLGKDKYKVILEAGTGSGIFLPELAKHCESIFACDIHSNFDNFHSLFKEYGITNYNISTQSIEATYYPDEFFDAVVAVSVLEFVKDIPKSLTEISRILKRDGVFITICPMESKVLDFFLSLYTRKAPKDEFGESRKRVSRFLEEHFIIVKKGYMIPLIGRLLPVYTHYKLKKPLEHDKP